MSDPNLFTYKMRKSTRKIHAVSDALVNAKLAMALNADKVWAEGLLVFYEIFKFLEEAMASKATDNLARVAIREMMRTEAFERDLAHYYGGNWKETYVIRESVAQYLAHLRRLRGEEPHLLLAYIYHLYMGLLSGGQILRKKRELKWKLRLGSRDEGITSGGGECVTDFGDVNIADLKAELKSRINEIAQSMDEELKERIILEGRKVFELNNMVIRSIGSTNKVLLQRALILGLAASVICLLYNYVL